jgi:hypothetical protein
MFFGDKTRIYQVYVKENSSEPLMTAEFVREGFNIWALFFDLFWLLYKRIWLAVILVIGFYGLNYYLLAKGVVGLVQVNIFRLGLKIWLGFEGQNLKCGHLERNGYVLMDVVTARDEMEAKRRFFDKYSFASSRVNVSSTWEVHRDSVFANRTVKPSQN